jgi:hypothetical protein
MLPSPATGRRTSKNVGPGPQFNELRDPARSGIRARASSFKNQRLNQRNRPARPPEPEF